jgi:hypothetical protein
MADPAPVDKPPVLSALLDLRLGMTQMFPSDADQQGRAQATTRRTRFKLRQRQLEEVASRHMLCMRVAPRLS